MCEKKKEYEPAVGQTSECIVPRQEGSKHTKNTTGLLQVNGGSGSAVVGSIFGTEEEQEGQVQGEEQGKEHDGGPEGAE